MNELLERFNKRFPVPAPPKHNDVPATLILSVKKALTTRQRVREEALREVENYKNKLRQYGYGDMLDTFEKQLKENEAQVQKAITI